MRTIRPYIPVLLVLCLFPAGCGLFGGDGIFGGKPERTQLQIRAFQTRMFHTDDPQLAMKAMLNVLQDEGYMVKNVDSSLGLLSATKEIDLRSRPDRAIRKMIDSLSVDDSDESRKKFLLIESTCNVELFGAQTRVRATFQMRLLDQMGRPMAVEMIEDPEFYQRFFAKVSQGIYLQTEKL